ncbi:unnamed protein product [Nippostrongylus brasiliensis]|uniref:Uncharacterized protein n=1 Tax=Nippostrongylus brasiliensis TaxID=27835 RepID=A0A0N4Y465_NIPBR|nr:unnamed protein product [Nippostrongylus brasiliensis]
MLTMEVSLLAKGGWRFKRNLPQGTQFTEDEHCKYLPGKAVERLEQQTPGEHLGNIRQWDLSARSLKGPVDAVFGLLGIHWPRSRGEFNGGCLMNPELVLSGWDRLISCHFPPRLD